MLKTAFFVVALFSTLFFVSATKRRPEGDPEGDIERVPKNTDLSIYNTNANVDPEIEEISTSGSNDNSVDAPTSQVNWLSVIPMDILNRILYFASQHHANYPGLLFLNKHIQNAIFYTGRWIPAAISQLPLQTVVRLVLLEDMKRQIKEGGLDINFDESQSAKMLLSIDPICKCLTLLLLGRPHLITLQDDVTKQLVMAMAEPVTRNIPVFAWGSQEDSDDLILADIGQNLNLTTHEKFEKLAARYLADANKRDRYRYSHAQVIIDNRSEILNHMEFFDFIAREKLPAIFIEIAMEINLRNVDSENRSTFLHQMAAHFIKEEFYNDLLSIAYLSEHILTPQASIKDLAEWYQEEKNENIKKAWLSVIQNSIEYSSAMIYYTNLTAFDFGIPVPKTLCADILLKNTLSKKHHFSRDHCCALLQKFHTFDSLLEIIAKYDEDSLKDVDKSIIMELSYLADYGGLKTIPSVITFISLDDRDEIPKHFNAVLSKLTPVELAYVIAGTGYAARLTDYKKAQIVNLCSDEQSTIERVKLIRSDRSTRLAEAYELVLKSRTFISDPFEEFMKTLSFDDLRAVLLHALSRLSAYKPPVLNKEYAQRVQEICEINEAELIGTLFDYVNKNPENVKLLSGIRVVSSLYLLAEQVLDCSPKPGFMKSALICTSMTRQEALRFWSRVAEARLQKARRKEQRRLAKIEEEHFMNCWNLS